MLGGRIHQPVDLIYVKTSGLSTDLHIASQEALDPERGKRNPPERALANGIIASLDRGEDVHVIGFSRGALVTQLALEVVSDHYREQGRSSRWVEEHVAPHITVETFNGASHTMLPGVRAKHYVRDSDVLVGQTIGDGTYAPEIRSALTSTYDHTLAKFNNLSPEQRTALSALAKDIAVTSLNINSDDHMFAEVAFTSEARR